MPFKKFGAMNFIYYINRSIATKLIWAIYQHHTAYMSCGERWARTSDV